MLLPVCLHSAGPQQECDRVREGCVYVVQVHTKCLECTCACLCVGTIAFRDGTSQEGLTMCVMTYRGRQVTGWLEVTTTMCKTGMKRTGKVKFLKDMDDGLPSRHGPVVHFPCTSAGMESEVTSFLLAELACLLRGSCLLRASHLVPKV